MGTNYYFVTENRECPECGQQVDNPTKQKYHMGKSSGGWFYLLKTREGCSSLQAWLNFMYGNHGYIEDEYGRVRTLEQWLHVVLARRGLPSEKRGNEDMWFSATYNLWYDPSLQRGDGPYSLCSTEFS